MCEDQINCWSFVNSVVRRLEANCRSSRWWGRRKSCETEIFCFPSLFSYLIPKHVNPPELSHKTVAGKRSWRLLSVKSDLQVFFWPHEEAPSLPSPLRETPPPPPPLETPTDDPAPSGGSLKCCVSFYGPSSPRPQLIPAAITTHPPRWCDPPINLFFFFFHHFVDFIPSLIVYPLSCLLFIIIDLCCLVSLTLGAKASFLTNSGSKVRIYCEQEGTDVSFFPCLTQKLFFVFFLFSHLCTKRIMLLFLFLLLLNLLIL